jgi:CO/xanthine dehydrogenase Mo-binding subunit
MTKPLPLNTRNVAVNMLQGEFRIIDQLAHNLGISTNEFIRRNLRRGIAMTHPTEAKLLIKIRRARTIAKTATCAVLALLMLIAGSDRRNTRRRDAKRDDVIEMEYAIELEAA